jgi:uncharacterized protein (TIGR02246 family)
MRSGATLLVMLAGAAIVPSSAHGQSAQAPTKAEAQKLLDANLGHRNAGRWDQFLNGHTADATILSSAGAWERGRAEMQKGLQENFAAGVYKGAQSTTTVESVQSIAPGVVLVDSTWELTNIPGGGTRKGRSATILVKSGDTWKIAAERNMVPRPAGAIKPGS